MKGDKLYMPFFIDYPLTSISF